MRAHVERSLTLVISFVPSSGNARHVLPIHIADRQPMTLADGTKRARSSSKCYGLGPKRPRLERDSLNQTDWLPPPLLFYGNGEAQLREMSGSLRTSTAARHTNKVLGAFYLENQGLSPIDRRAASNYYPSL